MTYTVRRYRGPRVNEEKAKTPRTEVATLVRKLVNVWGEGSETLARNVAWWRFRKGLTLQIRKVLP